MRLGGNERPLIAARPEDPHPPASPFFPSAFQAQFQGKLHEYLVGQSSHVSAHWLW